MFNGVWLVLLMIIFSCSEPDPRRPVSHHTDSFFEESVERNKNVNTLEEAAIKYYIAQDSSKTYIASSSGFWYAYTKRKLKEGKRPVLGDEVVFNYEILNLRNEILYSYDALGEVQYKIDKEEIELGLQSGLKIMKVGEEVSFLFPSHSALGILGDKDKIGMNQPLIYRVQLINLK